MKKFFSIISGLFGFISHGFRFLWQSFDYACRTVAHLPGWIGGIIMIVLILAVIKLILNR